MLSGQPASRQPRGLRQRLVEHVEGQRPIRPVFSASGMNSSGPSRPAGRVPPAHQRLDADDRRWSRRRPWAGSAARARRARCPRAARRAATAARACARRARGRRPRQRPRSSLASYSAMSARRHAAGRCSSPCSGASAMPTLACTSMRTPASGERLAQRPRPAAPPAPRASAGASAGPRRRSTANSSPPSRATRCRPRAPTRSRWPTSMKQQVADVVAEGVVDLLEVVQVDQQHRDGRGGRARRPASAPRSAVQQRAVRQAGEHVVQGVVLALGGEIGALAHRRDGQQQQREQQQREVRGHEHGRGERDQQPATWTAGSGRRRAGAAGRGSLDQSATAVPTSVWLTRKKTRPAAKAGNRSAGVKAVGRGSPAREQGRRPPRLAEKVSVYCETLKKGRVQSFPRRRSSMISGIDWRDHGEPSGATNTSARAKVRKW